MIVMKNIFVINAAQKKKTKQKNKRPIGLGALVVVLAMHDLK